MENISAQLHKLEKKELKLYDEWKQILSKRLEEDEGIKNDRAKERKAWQQRLRLLNKEQEKLRQERRELATNPTIPTPSVVAQSRSESATPVPERRSLRIGRKGPRKDSRQRRLIQTGRLIQARPRVPGRLGAPHWLPVSYDEDDQPLYERPSDGKLVYLECCINGCGKTGFATVAKLMVHSKNPKVKPHNGQRRLFGDASRAVETCSRLVPGQERDEEARGRDPDGGADAELQQSRSLAAEEMFRGFLSSGDETEAETEDDVMQSDSSKDDDLPPTSMKPSKPIVGRFVGLESRTELAEVSEAVKIEQGT